LIYFCQSESVIQSFHQFKHNVSYCTLGEKQNAHTMSPLQDSVPLGREVASMGNRIRLSIDGILSYTAAKTSNFEVQHFLSCMSARIRNHANSDTVSVMKNVLMRNRSAVTTRLLNNPA